MARERTAATTYSRGIKPDQSGCYNIQAPELYTDEKGTDEKGTDEEGTDEEGTDEGSKGAKALEWGNGWVPKVTRTGKETFNEDEVTAGALFRLCGAPG